MLLSQLTTAAVGGPARHFVEARSEQEIIDAVTAADQAGEKVLIIGGGSNLLVADQGFEGTVVLVASQGIETLSDYACGGTSLRVQAGHNWDELVAYTVEQELSGLEALSGIPGTVGAIPVQNVGAYGADVAQTIASVRTWDRQTSSYKTFANADLKFGYRDSLLKQTTQDGSPRYLVLTVDFQLPQGSQSAPIRYAELARQLGVEVGQRADSRLVRQTVLGLRASKGMVLDPQDRDTYSTGSFFTNPIVDQALADALPEKAPRYPASTAAGQPLEGKVKLSAAWLIQHAGFEKGFGLEGDSQQIAGGRASLSTKHTLAISNRGGASTSDIAAIARAVRQGVEQAYGIRLEAEPVVVGFEL